MLLAKTQNRLRILHMVICAGPPGRKLVKRRVNVQALAHVRMVPSNLNNPIQHP